MLGPLYVCFRYGVGFGCASAFPCAPADTQRDDPTQTLTTLDTQNRSGHTGLSHGGQDLRFSKIVNRVVFNGAILMLFEHIVGSDDRNGGLQCDSIRNISRMLAPLLGVQFELRQDPPMASECDWFPDFEFDEFRTTVPVFVGDHPRRCLLRKTLGCLSIFPGFADLGQGLAGVACIPLQLHGLGASD